MTDPIDPRTPVVIAARRTPVGTAGHSLAAVEVADLAAVVIDALADDCRALGLPVARRDEHGTPVDDIVLGNCLGPGGDIARVAALSADLPVSTPGVVVDRQCGSGQEAVHLAADRVRGGAGLIFAGGAESASSAPWRMHRPRSATEPPRPYSRAAFTPAEFGDPDMGPAAEEVARRCGISRVRQDAYAVRSHARARAARTEHPDLHRAEIAAVRGVVSDDRPRLLRPETLARLRPAFTPEGTAGTVTAGNSCGISDGAAMVAVVAEQTRAALGVPGLALTHHVAVGADPSVPGIAPVAAVQALLGRSGVVLPDVGLVEITEAFAAQTLACADLLGIDPLGADDARWCPDGGAIALGHPWGASGALLVVRLFARMVRRDGPGMGIATCAIGGGQGLALLARRVG